MVDSTTPESQTPATSQTPQPILKPHTNTVVPHAIADYDTDLVQLNVWTGTKWINVFDGNDMKNMSIDLHRVAKVVDDQVVQIDDAVKRADDAVEQAGKAVDSSNVNKAAIDAANSAIAEAKQSASDAVQKLQSVESSVNTTVDALNKTVTDNSAAVSVLNDEIKLKVDTTTVNKIVDGKGFATTNTVQSLVDQKASQISQTIADVKTTVDGNGNAISATNDRVSNLTQAIDGIQTTVKDKADQSQITQLSNQLTAKVSANDYQTEIAALEKDLNLRVQKGDLISQINLEAGGDGLISVQNGKGKLMLDADSVVFGNKAFIPSAAITNIQADQITSGTLDAGNIRVINLTADSIHGGTLDVGNMNVKNFSADDIKTGTLTGIKVKTGTSDRFFQTSKNNIYWVHDGGTSLIGDDTYLNSGNGLTIADQHNILLTLWSGATVKDDNIINSAGNMGYPKIIIDNDGGWNADDPFGSGWGDPQKPQIVQWIAEKEYLRLTPGKGAEMHLNNDIAGSEFSIQKDNCTGAYFGHGEHGNQIHLITAGNGQGVNVFGDLHVSGSKNSIVNTKQGYLAINAYETAEYYFGDIGEDNTGNAGQVVIGIDRIFNDLVNTNIQYQVFVTPYTDAHVWVEKRYNNRFIVKSDKPNAEFGWELKAKRKGYESNRLRRVDVDFNPLDLKGETK